MWKTALVRISNICMSIEKSNCKLWPEFVTFLNFYILDAAALGATILSIQWIRNWRVWLQKLQRGKCSLRCWCWSVEILKSFYPQLHKRQSSPDFERILCSWIKDNYPHNHFLPTGEEVEAPCVNFRGENVPCATHVGGNLHYHQQNDDVHTMHTLRNTERTNVQSGLSLVKEYDWSKPDLSCSDPSVEYIPDKEDCGRYFRYFTHYTKLIHLGYI